MSTKCYLVSLENTHEDIELVHGVATTIGRTPLCKIQDPRCSRQQVELIADCKRHRVKVKQLGGNITAIDDECLQKDQEAIIEGSGPTLFVLEDAAGRPKDWAPKKKKDFSLSDRLFAINIGIRFKTPEAFFQGAKEAPYTKPSFDPRELKAGDDIVPKGYNLVSKAKEIIVLVGYPACGKSHLTNVLKTKGYKSVNRDTLGTWQKCVKKAQECVINSSVVVDNTNLSQEERARYINVAKEAKVPCRCFVFTTTLDHCRHNERFRQLTDKSHAKISDMIFNTIKGKFQEPSTSEGFSEVVKVNFVPSFSTPALEQEYRKFLLEK